MENKPRIFDNFMTIFQRRSSSPRSPFSTDSPKSIPFLSPIANSVVARCSKVLNTPTEDLCSSFDIETGESGKQHFEYARHLLEFCSYRAFDVLTARADYFSDKEFRRLTYDMMLAWEAPGVEDETIYKESVSPSTMQSEDDDGWSFFYSSSTAMAVQVDSEKTVGPEAFARIAPACAVIADVATVQNLFDALTNTSGDRLHFLIYDKYLQSLDRVIKSAKSVLSASSNLEIVDGEIIVDVDGTVPTQPVLQHIGISAWPGRLTLSSKALYFESLGVGQYDKPAQYDLSRDLKQVIKPELTGPLGARLFDKAVMYRSMSLTEPIFLEFPEFKGSSRRDYWLDVSLEILLAHRFVRRYNLKGVQESEAVARAILGIFRCRAVREGFYFFSSHYKSLLVFNLAENLPGGDAILETLSSCLALLRVSSSQADSSGIVRPVSTEKQHKVSPVSLLALRRFGLILQEDVEFDKDEIYGSGYICVGEVDPLEVAIKQSKVDTGKAEAARETVNQVKVDGIDANLAIMKELLFPLILLAKRVQFLASWEEPFKSTVFMLLTCYLFVSGWFTFVLPFILVSLAVLMLWRRLANKGKLVDAFKIVAPPNRNAVEQLITLQEAISQVEGLVQAVNVVLLKMRALLFAVLPEATYTVAIFLLLTAAFFVLVPFRFIILFVLMEPYTREMPLRRESSYRSLRRLREWWFGIPAAPVQLIKYENSKKKK
ncbi:uncharacterized protein [Spinacia oleracea]|uniref:Uncharacterized protein isoform X1 n=2 Tax=Spinacia oleracea TaxID=3562 RepID=A0A9R0JP43_SPIOL|nr:uncharacterized protein LOC110782127 isoform X1 [Spinacia oleracea]